MPQLYVDVDREKAKALGVPLDEVFNTLAATLGTYYVNDFNKYGRTWQVLMSAERGYRKRPDDVGRSLGALRRGRDDAAVGARPREVHVGPGHRSTASTTCRRSRSSARARRVSAPGQAIADGRADRREVLPPDFSFDWGGASFQEKRSPAPRAWRSACGALMVFLILAAQYEKWSLPLSVLLALPFGTFGALAAVWLRGMTNDVYFQIGLVTLLGLAAKNAILIVEFALLKRHAGPVARRPPRSRRRGCASGRSS